MAARVSPTIPWTIEEGAFPRHGTPAEQARHLVGYAIVAPSIFNSQPWRFRAWPYGVDVLADMGRWLRVADDDRRELHVSLGCAVENLVIAARHYGLRPWVDVLPEPPDETLVARVWLRGGGEEEPGGPEETDVADHLFEALVSRRTDHERYPDAPLSTSFTGDLERMAGSVGPRLTILTDVESRTALRRLALAADARNADDAAYRDEIALWLDRGVFSESWLFAHFERLGTAGRAPAADPLSPADLVRLVGAPATCVITTATDDRASQIAAGRLYERVALAATLAGLGVQPETQALEEPDLRAAYAEVAAPAGRWAQHAFHVGRPSGARWPAPRRPVTEVLAVG